MSNIAELRALETRKELGLAFYEPVDIFKVLCEIEGISVAIMEMSDKMSGLFTRKNIANLIVINSRKSFGHQRFTSAHEYYHFKYGRGVVSRVCSIRKFADDNPEEREANIFALNILIPADGLKYVLQRRIKGKKMGISDIIFLEQYFGVSHQCMLIRLSELEIINEQQKKEFGSNIIAKAKAIMQTTGSGQFELNPVTNEALYKWLMKLPRKFSLVYTRFKYICTDFNFIPIAYQEAMLRLADLGIVTPEAKYDKNSFKNFVDIFAVVRDKTKQLPKLSNPDIRFNTGRLLTRAEAVDMITKVFDESKRVVFDEMTFRQGRVDDYGYNSYYHSSNPAVGNVLYHNVGDKITYRIDELWQLLFTKYALTVPKANFTQVYEFVEKKPENLLTVGIGFAPRFCAIGPVFRGGFYDPIMPLYDATKAYPF